MRKDTGINQLLYILISLLLFASCQLREHPNATTHAALRFFNGEWVRADYVDELIKTRSPYRSRGKLEGIVSLLIDPTGIAGDTLHIGASWNNHEGYAFNMILPQGHNTSSFTTDLADLNDSSNYYELGYKLMAHDTCLILYHFSKTKQILDSVVFKKVGLQIETDCGAPIQYIANQVLISGQYILYDSSGNNRSVTFDNTGNVAGMPGYNSYMVLTDFIGPETQDCMSMTEDKKKYDDFTFELTKDSLKLYTTSVDTNGETVTGKLKFVLVKKQ